jgi:transcriptional regulator with XRE-family HTH domain
MRVEASFKNRDRFITLGITIAAVRKLRGMSQIQLAEKANVTQAQIARVENLTYSPSLDTLTKILNGLELDLGFVDRNTGKLIRFVSK